MPKKGLGKGLSALITETDSSINSVSDVNSGVFEVDINNIEPNREQPRKKFKQEELESLADSIKIHGILQPILVIKRESFYEIIVGERRWRAARIAGLKSIPVIVKEYDTLSSLEVSLIENLHRENLNPIEEALTYKKFVDEFGLSHDEISEKVAKNRSTISNSLRLLKLDARVQNFVIENKISYGHAKALLSISFDNDLQFELSEIIIEENLSVRDTESLVRAKLSDHVEGANDTVTEVDETSSDVLKYNKQLFRSVEADLHKLFGTKVKISKGKNKGKIEIEYYSDDDLDRLLGLMKKIES